MNITKDPADKVIAALEGAKRVCMDRVQFGALVEALSTMRGLAEDAEPQNNEALWLWKNGDHMLAYRHLYPRYEGGDPMVLGEPVAKAYFRQSFDRGGTSPQAAQTALQSESSAQAAQALARLPSEGKPIEALAPFDVNAKDSNPVVSQNQQNVDVKTEAQNDGFSTPKARELAEYAVALYDAMPESCTESEVSAFELGWQAGRAGSKP